MQNYKYLLLCTFLILIISLGTVYASQDLNQTEIIDSTQNDSNITSTTNGGTFGDIQTEIDNASDGAKLDLGGNFISEGNEIHINKSITIDGHKNTTLDGKGLSCFIYLDHVPKLSVNGIKFINSKFYGDTVVRWNNGYADEYVFTNCDFKDNIGYFLEISSKKATFTDCNFINNDNGIFMLDSEELTIRNCNFIKNTNQLVSRAKTIDNCNFQENTARDFDLIDKVQSITNSKFIKNYLIINTVNTMYNNRFESNDCGYYMVYNAGTVEKCVFNKNKVLIFKKCNTLKNSRFENNKADIVDVGGSVINCKFLDNKGGNHFLKVSSITDSYFKNMKDCYIKGKNLVVKNSDFINVRGYVAATKINKCIFSKTELDVKADSISNCKFTKNIFYGNSVNAKTVKKCQFIQNKCKTTMMHAKTVVYSKFIKNIADGDLTSVTKTMSNCRFEKNNFAKTEQGFLVNNPKLLKNCLFKNNNGKKGSLVINANTITGCTFKSNKVTHYGMGVAYYVKKVLNSKFINNKALRGTGGAIDDVHIVKKCTFKNNYALAGGAISTVGKFSIEKCVFEKNKVKHSASAIYLSAIPKTLKGTIKNCKFIKNKSKGKLNPYNYPFKNYKRGTIFAFGDYKMKITIKKCKGL